MDPAFSIRGGDTNRELFERAAKAAHRVSFKVGKNEQGSIFVDILADIVFLEDLAVWHVENEIRSFSVENVDIEVFRPAMLFENPAVAFRVETVPAHVVPVRRIAFDNGSVHFVDDGLHKFRPQKVLIAFFARMQLDGHVACQLLAQRLIQADKAFRTGVFGEIHF